MAASSPPGHGRPDDDGADSPPTLLDRIAPDTPPTALRAAAFWSAVVLPFLHVPLLTTGLTTPADRQAFLVLLLLNALALYAGHGYGAE